jgi:predicted DNA-binding protein
MDRRDKVNNVFRSIRIPKEDYIKLENIAQREHRTVASLVYHYVVEGIERDEQKENNRE